MEYLNVEFRPEQQALHLPDFPEAEKVISLDGLKAQELADMSLCNADLEICLSRLDEIDRVEENPGLREALWESSLIRFLKGFGNNNARKFKLIIDDILGNDPEGTTIFETFQHWRDKNIAHDDNSLTQCFPAAVLNRRDSEHKIAKIVCLAILQHSPDEGGIQNLRTLINKSKDFCQKRIDQLTLELTDELSKYPYDVLADMPQVVYNKAKVEEYGKNRPKI